MARGGPPGRPKAPPGYKKLCKGVRIREWVWDWLDEQEDPRGTMLEDALVERYKLKPPEVQR